MVGTRLLPPRANGPTLTLALASIEMRNMVSAASATPLTRVTWSKMASVSGSFFGADSWPLAVENSLDHSIWCRWFRQLAVRYPSSLFGRSTDVAPRPLSGEYRGGWSGIGGRPGSGYRRWLGYPSRGWGDALPHVSAHAEQRHRHRSRHCRVRAGLYAWSSAPTAGRARRAVARPAPVL